MKYLISNVILSYLVYPWPFMWLWSGGWPISQHFVGFWWNLTLEYKISWRSILNSKYLNNLFRNLFKICFALRNYGKRNCNYYQRVLLTVEIASSCHFHPLPRLWNIYWSCDQVESIGNESSSYLKRHCWFRFQLHTMYIPEI